MMGIQFLLGQGHGVCINSISILNNVLYCIRLISNLIVSVHMSCCAHSLRLSEWRLVYGLIVMYTDMFMIADDKMHTEINVHRPISSKPLRLSKGALFRAIWLGKYRPKWVCSARLRHYYSGSQSGCRQAAREGQGREWCVPGSRDAVQRVLKGLPNFTSASCARCQIAFWAQLYSEDMGQY